MQTIRLPQQDYQSVFHVTHYKAGSQWVYAVLAALAPERIVVPLPKVAHVLGGNIEPGRIYPTAYITRQVFDALDAPHDSRVFVVTRDPRDTLVSMYFSHRYSHPETSDVIRSSRSTLSTLSVRDGLARLMEKNLSVSMEIIRSWIGTSHLHVTYEQLLDDEQALFERIVEYCGIDATKKRIGEAVRAVSFEQLTQRSRGVEDVNSHQRKGVAGDWRNYFDDDLRLSFKDLYGDVLIAGGYESDHDW